MTATTATSGLRRWRRFLLFSLVSVGIVITWLNIQPYINIMEFWLSDSNDAPFWLWLSSLPVIKWLVDNVINRIGFTIMGFLLWAVFQLFELAPFILQRSAAAMQLLIAGIERFVKIEIKEDDDEFLTSLKQRHNSLPRRLIRGAFIVAIGFYIVDGILCLLTYPPIRGGLESLGLFLIAPALEDIDGRNFLSALTTLFGFEAIVRAIYWVKNITSVFGSEAVPKVDWQKWRKKKDKKKDKQHNT